MKKAIIGLSGLLVFTFFIIFSVNAKNSGKELVRANAEVSQNISQCPSVATDSCCSGSKMTNCCSAKGSAMNCNASKCKERKCDQANCKKGQCDPSKCKSGKCDQSTCNTNCKSTSCGMVSGPMNCNRKK